MDERAKITDFQLYILVCMTVLLKLARGTPAAFPNDIV